MARGNVAEYEERAIRPMHDFGFSPTAHAGGAPGEIGGIVWRDEQPAYYADSVGPFSLDDELVASGKIAFTGAGSDSGIYFGWFNAGAKRNKATPDHKEGQTNVIGIAIEGPSRVGHYFRPVLYSISGKDGILSEGPLIRPDGKVHQWKLQYRPDGADGEGEIVLSFDDSLRTFPLKKGTRAVGARFDRFGLFNMQTGGHHVVVYLDDLSYSKSPRR